MMNRRKDPRRLVLPFLKKRDPLPVDPSCVSSPTSLLNEEQNAKLLSAPGGRDGIINHLNGVEYINAGSEDQCEIYGYRRSYMKTGLTWLLIVLTGGFLRLIFHWVPHLMLMATHGTCPLREATRVLIVEQYKKYTNYYVKDLKDLVADQISQDQEYSALRPGLSLSSKPSNANVENGGVILQERHNQAKHFDSTNPKSLIVPSSSGQLKEVYSIRWFNLKKLLYLWDPDTETFYKLRGLDVGQTLWDLHAYHGLSWKEQLRRRIVYGNNEIEVPVKPLLKLLFLEALNPFYIFQVFSVCLWYADDYIYYASVIVLTSVLSIVSEVYQMNRNQVSLRATVQSSGVVEVLRENGQPEVIPSEHLVPGDVLVIPSQGCMMQCDAALLQGTAIVNESTLTGESVPVTKTPILNRKDSFFKEKEHGRHVIFCGTQVIQTRFYGNERVTAVVLRTGFLTSKGSLVRSIMYPPPVDFKFQQDSYKFIIFLVGIASFGFTYTVITKVMGGLTVKQIAMDSLDLITIVVPPALPMAMTVGILYALQRLKRYNIFCISPRSINISGVLNCICFDKTGTLTEDGLDMKGVVGVQGSGVEARLQDLCSSKELPNDHLLFGMTTCHSITIISMQMVGDPLDLKMFESTGWVLEEPGNDDTSKYDMIMPSVVRPAEDKTDQSGSEPDQTESPLEIGILRQFPFSSSLQRMSVITRKLTDPNFILYCKGSPEMIASLSKPESVPSNFHEVLLGFTEKGFRVLALAWRPLKLTYPKAHRISREEVEEDLIFSGLLVLENRLKDETTPVIRQLKNADIRNIMVTGDNMLTALSVARECGLVSADEEVITVKSVSKEGLNGSYELHMESTSKVLTATKMARTDIDSVSITMRGRRYCFATEGKSWAIIQSHFPEFISKLLVRGSVFARMNPDQKQQLVMELQALGYYVGMCGDGANDCGALKTAHAGISLSETEASVASPFTSKEPNISCVPALIREGRTALVTSFGIFKYMATYSLTQFVSVMILYSIQSNLTDIQFLYIDLFLITLFAFFFGRTDSYKGPLASTAPSSSLISVAPILSILLHMVIVISFQTFMFFYVQEQTWFVPFNQTTAEEILGGHENYAVYSISQFQYIILALVFAKGPPYRKPLYTNYLFTGSAFIMIIVSVLLTVTPPDSMIEIFELVMPSSGETSSNFFRWQIIIFALINCLLAIFVEYVIIDYFVHRKLKYRFRNENKTKKKYLAIEEAMDRDKNWPLIIPGKPLKYTTSKSTELELNVRKLNMDTNNTHQEKKDQNCVIACTQYHSSL